MDAASDTGVLWHCGSAPRNMCDPAYRPEAQIHSNRKMPLLVQFPLKPGRITLARLTQAGNKTRMVVGGGEVIRAPLSFTGTSGVVRFDNGTETAMRGLLDHALEHHLAIVYGDQRGAVQAAGRQLGLEVVALS
jgi:L-fucose isomerase-like protein